MWVEQLPSGKYRYLDRYTDSSGKIHKVGVTLDKNSKQAERIAREQLRAKIAAAEEAEKIDQVDPTILTFDELCELYLVDQRPLLKPSTWSRNKYALNTLKTILGPNTACQDLSAGYIRRCLLKTEKGPGTLNEHLKRLRTVIRWGYKNDYIEDIRFLDKLDNFKDVPHRAKIEDKFLEADELARLLESMDRYYDLTLFLALSGLRFGEAAALTRSDLNISERKINVDKTYDNNNRIVTSPKSYTSTRSVYMQDELYDLCKHILAKNKILTMNNLVFTTNNDYVSYHGYNHYLKRKALEVLERPITAHTLRHTHASLLMEQGVDIETISARLGHSNSKITKEIYLHVTTKLEEQRNQALKEINIMGG